MTKPQREATNLVHCMRFLACVNPSETPPRLLYMLLYRYFKNKRLHWEAMFARPYVYACSTSKITLQEEFRLKI